uniref:Dilute domain-containing protein n=1 Tax=Labrus bergylta TaxID=56723 RepID=A0A3Q3GTE0_9LABR
PLVSAGFSLPDQLCRSVRNTQRQTCRAAQFSLTESVLSHQVLYPILPGLLDYDLSRGSPELEVTVESAPVLDKGGLQVPGEIQQLVEVLTETWKLLSDCQLHAEISSQLIGYLFYFINASLFNSLMERGSERGFFQWSQGVRMRSNLNVLLDWAHTAGLGELALKHTHTLSSAINLLATPRKILLQVRIDTHACMEISAVCVGFFIFLI